jgi:PAS domain S-box-containing protein
MKLHPLSWITGSLRRQFIMLITTSLTIASLICLLLFISLYYKQLAQERSTASAAVNRLLQTSLENAMLKQDLDGLREIVQKLGQQPDVSLVMISNPEREIRFSSDPTRLGNQIEWPSGNLPTEAITQFSVNDRGENVLRSINPVHNKAPCTQCHGPIDQNPINGVLFVDYNAAPIRDKARYNSLLFVMAGILIIGLSVVILWWFVHNIILIPLQRLANASQAFGEGDLSVRVIEMGKNEIGQLAGQFNEMATNLQNNIREIQEKEAFLQALIDAVPDGLRVIDQDYQIIKVNKAFCKQINVKKNSVLKRKCYQSTHARSSPCPPTLITCPLYETAQSGQPVKSITQHRTADGSSLDVEVFAAPMVVESGGKTLNFIVESIRDLNQAIKFSHEQKLAAMGQLASGMAHEIYNPLTSVRLALQSTLRTLEGGESDPTQIIDYLKLVDGEIDKCVEVTQRLLKLAAPGSEKRQPVLIHLAITETLALLGFESRENNIEIELLLDEENYQVFARENDIRMVILNLAQNAFHAMPQGGKLTLQTWRQEGYIYICFTDTGTGIPPKYQSQIFDPFFTHRADKKQGIGLGLSISKTLLSYYNGRIEFTSEWGEGSQFTVILPENCFALLDQKEAF